MKKTNWDAVAAATPNDQTAGAVVSQGGYHFDVKHRVPPHVMHQDTPPPMRSADDRHGVHPATMREMVGVRSGRLTVIGLSTLGPGGKNGKARWVVRCDCGMYEVRNRKALLKRADPRPDACWECRYVRNIKADYAESGGMEIGEFARAHGREP